MMTQFRTATGQTGRDAYEFEAAQILNARRELDARVERLLRVMHEEAPEIFECSTDFFPDWSGVEVIAQVVDLLREQRVARQSRS
jgi:hypothetical protein